MNIFLAPGWKRDNIEDGVLRGLNIKDTEIKDKLLKKRLSEEYGEENARIWALRKTGALKYWEMVEKGDFILFYCDKIFIYVGRVTFKYPFRESPDEIEIGEYIVKKVWGNNSEGSYLIFLKNVRDINLPLTTFNEITGYKYRGVQGFIRVAKDNAKQGILQYLNES